MKKVINAIKNYIKDYNKVQTEMLQSQGASYVNSQLFAMSMGIALF